MKAHAKTDSYVFYFMPSTAASISLIGEDVVNVTESGQNLVTFQVVVTGFSFAALPLQILPLSYTQFEEQRERFGITTALTDLGRIPPDPAIPCELRKRFHVVQFDILRFGL